VKIFDKLKLGYAFLFSSFFLKFIKDAVKEVTYCFVFPVFVPIEI